MVATDTIPLKFINAQGEREKQMLDLVRVDTKLSLFIQHQG